MRETALVAAADQERGRRGCADQPWLVAMESGS